MRSDTGESTASINARSDAEAWPSIAAGLCEGGHLVLERVIGKLAFVPVGDERHHKGARILTLAFGRRLVDQGLIEPSGIDRYEAAPRLLADPQTPVQSRYGRARHD